MGPGVCDTDSGCTEPVYNEWERISGYECGMARIWNYDCRVGLYIHIGVVLNTGTIERLSGLFKDQMNILRSFPAADGTGDTIVEIVNEPR